MEWIAFGAGFLGGLMICALAVLVILLVGKPGLMGE